jgi:DNA-binding CsgD family transcriptional regulator
LFFTKNYRAALPTPMKKQVTRRSSPPHVWTRKELARLGKVSDAELARNIGISPHKVFIKRTSLGIPALHPQTPIKWGRKELALLGKHPDAEVARLLKISRKATIGKRLALGITCYARNSQLWHVWTQREIALLGTRTDADVAKKIGVSLMCVATKRYKLNIPAFSPRKNPNRPTRKLADWTKQEVALLGTTTDLQAAEQLNLSSYAARLKRISLGIPPFRKQSGPSIWMPKVIARLGKESCQKIANDIGVSRQRVHQKCLELGITP